MNEITRFAAMVFAVDMIAEIATTDHEASLIIELASSYEPTDTDTGADHE